MNLPLSSYGMTETTSGVILQTSKHIAPGNKIVICFFWRCVDI